MAFVDLRDEEKSFFTDDVILPVQWAELSKQKEHSPDRRLIFAVLEDGINCYLGRGSVAASFEVANYHKQMTARRLKLQSEAEVWLFTDSPCYLSLQFCCDTLGINVAWLRKGLKKVRRRIDHERARESGSLCDVAKKAGKSGGSVGVSGKNACTTVRESVGSVNDWRLLKKN